MLPSKSLAGEIARGISRKSRRRVANGLRHDLCRSKTTVEAHMSKIGRSARLKGGGVGSSYAGLMLGAFRPWHREPKWRSLMRYIAALFVVLTLAGSSEPGWANSGSTAVEIGSAAGSAFGTMIYAPIKATFC